MEHELSHMGTQGSAVLSTATEVTDVVCSQLGLLNISFHPQSWRMPPLSGSMEVAAPQTVFTLV